MVPRYLLYIVGGLSFIALFFFAYATIFHLESKINNIDYLNNKFINQETLLINLSSQRSELSNAKGSAYLLHQAELINDLNFSDAPVDLREDAHLNKATSRLSNAQPLTEQVNAQFALSNMLELLKDVNSDLLNAHTNQFNELKSDVSTFVWVCAVLLVLGTASVAIPFFLQHERTLLQAKETNARLSMKANELSATHATMGNMLEDIVHERRQATRTAEINARLAAIINSADDIIFSLNLAGIIVTSNDAAQRVFGDQVIGKRFIQLFPSETADKLRALIMATGEQNTGSTCDLSFENNEQKTDLSITLSPIRSELNKLVGYSVIAKDVSNMKLEEERFRLAVEAAPNAMIMVNHHGFIVLINSEAESIFGYSKEELFGQSIHMLVPDNFRDEHAKQVHEFMKNPGRRAMGQKDQRLYGQKKSGRKFPIEVNLTPIQIEKEIYIISSIVDISDRLEQQSALHQLNNELSQKNKEMEQFIYAVSHDLKAPLVTISGFAERLLNAEEIKHNPRNKHKLDRIISNVRSMDALLQDLLSLSRVIKRDLEKDWIDPEVTLHNLMAALELNIAKEDAEIKIISPLYKIYAQESLFLQCLQNIISNALKYRKPDSAPIIIITPIRDRHYVGLSISDNGIGISEKHQQKIFNVFERLHPNLSDGNGVGLSIVKTIMDKHKGKIIVDSKENNGSKFTLLFPNPTNKPLINDDKKTATYS